MVEAFLAWIRKHPKASFAVLFVSLVAIGALLRTLLDTINTVFDEVRIDFDDLLGIDLVGLGTMGLALAAILRVFKNGWVEKHHHEQLEERVRLLEEGRLINGLDELE